MSYEEVIKDHNTKNYRGENVIEGIVQLLIKIAVVNRNNMLSFADYVFVQFVSIEKKHNCSHFTLLTLNKCSHSYLILYI